MSGMKEAIEIIARKTLIGSYSCLSSLRRKSIRNKSKSIVIIMSGVLGDCVVLLGTLRELIKMYSPQKGYQITIVCCTGMRTFLSDNLSEEIRLISCDVKGADWPSVAEFKNMAASLRNMYFDKCIVLMLHGWADYLALCVNADQKIKMCSKYQYDNKVLISKFVCDHMYNNFLKYENELFLAKAGARLIHSLNHTDYSTEKEMIKYRQGVNTQYKDYIIVAPMASSSWRNLSSEQTIAITEYILDRTNAYVLITGEISHAAFIESIIDFINSERVVNYAGKTNLEEFIQLIKGSKMVIGSDSGHIHLAAALDIPSVCLPWKGVMGLFFPYDYDKKSANDPICAFSDIPCKNCMHHGKKPGNRNRQCTKRIRNGENALCVETIDLKRVFQSIDDVLVRLEGDSQ